jgi:hypothetical protein
MSSLLEWLQEMYTEPSDKPLVESIMRYTKGFWKGLFTCYDDYFIPRTNNDLEQFFRRTKASHRRITGLRNWSTYIHRNGEMIVLVSDALRLKDVMSRIRSVSYEAFKSRKEQWDYRLKDNAARRRFNRKPADYLSNLEKQWNESQDC